MFTRVQEYQLLNSLLTYLLIIQFEGLKLVKIVVINDIGGNANRAINMMALTINLKKDITRTLIKVSVFNSLASRR